MTRPLLIVAAGGTGGHMFPAQALAQEMLRRGWRVALTSDDRGLRYADGFPDAVERREMRSATFAQGGVLARLAAPLRITLGIIAAVLAFRRDRPACIAGFGGYPSIPALAGGVLTGSPRLIHEQNGVLGRINRLFGARVQALAYGAAAPANAPQGANLVDIGNPIRDAALAAMSIPYAPPVGGPVSLLVFGGSQGASALSELIPAAIALLPEALRARLRLTQQAREAEVDSLCAACAGNGVAAEIAPFFDDMPTRIANAQLVICRAGASTIAELTAIGRPAILIPYPAAMDDHQTANARPMADADAAILAPQAQLTAAGLAGHLGAVLENPDRAAAMAAAARKLGRPDAARDLADLVERTADTRAGAAA